MNKHHITDTNRQNNRYRYPDRNLFQPSAALHHVIDTTENQRGDKNKLARSDSDRNRKTILFNVSNNKDVEHHIIDTAITAYAKRHLTPRKTRIDSFQPVGKTE